MIIKSRILGIMALTALLSPVSQAQAACKEGDVLYSANTTGTINCATAITTNGAGLLSLSNLNVSGAVTIAGTVSITDAVYLNNPLSGAQFGQFGYAPPLMSSGTLTREPTLPMESWSSPLELGNVNQIAFSTDNQLFLGNIGASSPGITDPILDLVGAPGGSPGPGATEADFFAPVVLKPSAATGSGSISAETYKIINAAGAVTGTLTAPPVCTGTNKALQYNGTSWLCVTL